MTTHEWSIFDRLDEVEKITLEQMEKTDAIEPTLKNTATRAKDASLLAFFALGMGFMASAIDYPNPRELKDRYIHALKRLGLSERALKITENVLIETCELIEKGGTSK
jgi:hypothetical protein